MEQIEIAEIAKFDMEDHVEQEEQLGIEYDILDSTQVVAEHNLYILFVKCKIVISALFPKVCPGQILYLTLVMKYAFQLSTNRITGILMVPIRQGH